MSKWQDADVRTFKQLWPTVDSVQAYFAPVKWQGVLRRKSNALLYPDMSLMILDEQYIPGLAAQVIYNNLTGIYSLACPKEPVDQDGIQRTAEMLVSRYGAELSVCGMYYYLADYLADYKATYTRFDLTDILVQCGKYMSWWRNALDKARRSEETQQDNAEKGEAGLLAYLKQEYVAKGLDIKESSLYKSGMIPDSVIKALEL